MLQRYDLFGFRTKQCGMFENISLRTQQKKCCFFDLFYMFSVRFVCKNPSFLLITRFFVQNCFFVFLLLL